MDTEAIKDRIKRDMISAMRSKDKERLGVIRMLQAAIKQKEVDQRIVLDDNETLAVIEKMIKQRRDSVQQFTQGNRPELAAKESQEITLLETYLPMALTEGELTALIDTIIQQLQASSIKDLGKVMHAVKEQAQGRVDMAAVSARIKHRLSER